MCLEFGWKPNKALNKLVDAHFPGARIKKRPEMVDQSGKLRANSGNSVSFTVTVSCLAPSVSEQEMVIQLMLNPLVSYCAGRLVSFYIAWRGLSLTRSFFPGLWVLVPFISLPVQQTVPTNHFSLTDMHMRLCSPNCWLRELLVSTHYARISLSRQFFWNQNLQVPMHLQIPENNSKGRHIQTFDPVASKIHWQHLTGNSRSTYNEVWTRKRKDLWFLNSTF